MRRRHGLTLVEVLVVLVLAGVIVELSWVVGRQAMATMASTERKADATTTTYLAYELVRGTALDAPSYWCPPRVEGLYEPDGDGAVPLALVGDHTFRFDGLLLRFDDTAFPLPLTVVRFYRDGPLLSFALAADRSSPDGSERSRRERSALLGSVCLLGQAEGQTYEHFVAPGDAHPGCLGGLATLHGFGRRPTTEAP